MGGSESRFIIQQEGASDYITQSSKSKLGDIVGYAPRDTNNALQKIVFKQEGKYSALRYDLHPQNYIGVVDSKVVMLDTFDEKTHWKLVLFQKKVSSETVWLDLKPTDMNLSYDTNKDHSLKVAFFHPATKSFLTAVAGTDSPQLLAIPSEYNNGSIASGGRSHFAAFLSSACWVVECVGHATSTTEGTPMTNFPMIMVGENTFSGFFTLDAAPVIGISGVATMMSHGTDNISDRLENLVFDSGRSGLMPEAWEETMDGLKSRVAVLEAKIAQLENSSKV